MLSLYKRGVQDKKDLMDALNSFNNSVGYDIKKDRSGSLQVSPSHRILSVSGGKLIDIMKVE